MSDFSISFCDGSALSDLSLNGNNFISKSPVSEDTFAHKLHNVVIDGPTDQDSFGLVGTHQHMELIQITQYDGEYWFILRDIPQETLNLLKTRGDIEYIAMMTGVEL